MNMPEHWMVRIGKGDHFVRSSKFSIWGINTKDKSNTSKFIKEANEKMKCHCYILNIFPRQSPNPIL